MILNIKNTETKGLPCPCDLRRWLTAVAVQCPRSSELSWDKYQVLTCSSTPEKHKHNFSHFYSPICSYFRGRTYGGRNFFIKIYCDFC